MTIKTVLLIFLHQANDQIHDFIGAFAVEVAGRFVAEKEGWVGDDGAGNGDTLFLSAGELAGIVVHALGETDDAESGFDVLAAFGLGELGEQQRQLDVLKGGEHGNQVVHLEDEADVARAPLGELAGGHVGDFVAGDGDAAGVGTSRPPSKLSKVVLPEPLGPMKATKSPLSTSRFRPCKTWISSPPRRRFCRGRGLE